MSHNPHTCSCKTVEPCGNCGCAPSQTLYLGIAAVPTQTWEDPYDSHTALIRGTIFPGLSLPFFVTGGECHD